jgi:branched-chain amino acid transport system substrate-binding protein
LKKRGASTATVGALFIVGLLIGAGVVYLAAPSLISASTTTVTAQGATVTASGGTTTVTAAGGTVTITGPATTVTQTAAASGLCNGGTVTIGALNDLSGGLSAQGAGDLAAEQLAIQDVNSYVQGAGCSVTFALNNNDYKLDNPTALSQLQAMAAAGVQVVVGPLNSGTAQYILSYANSNHIVLISPSSTSPALHFSNTNGVYLFRTAPNDAAQGQADAREILSAGAQAVIIVNRDDTYGDGLANATAAWLAKDSSTVKVYGPYKYDTSTTDFSALLAQINSDFQTAASAVGAAHVAIYSVSFQELGTMLIQAHNSATYSYLLNTTLPWFGTDGEAQNSLLTNATTSGPQMAQVRLPSTLFNVVNNSKSVAFYQRIKGTSAGAAILGGGAFYTFEGYDDVWIAALSILSAGKNSGSAVQAILPTVAANFYGLTGWEGLTGNDRIPGSYQIWSVVSSNGVYNWVLAGTWSYDTDSVTWVPSVATWASGM